MNKTVLITGASKGIGLALTKLLLEKNCNVIGTCRSGKIENFSHPNLTMFKLDLSDETSIDEAAKRIASNYYKIDILINNAGIGPDLEMLLPEKESFLETFNVNVTGTVFFTESLIKTINEGGMILNVSSIMGSIGLCSHSGSAAYRMSKTALNMYTKVLANRLDGKMRVAAIHPGWVRTTIAKSNITDGKLSPEESALKILSFILSDFKTGIYWNTDTASEAVW